VDFINYLNSNDIIIVKNFAGFEKYDYSDSEVKKHIDLIIKVQKILNDYDPNDFFIFKSYVWKKPEHLNKNLRSLKKYYNKILEDKPKNEYEDQIFKYGEEYIKLGTRCSDELKSVKYKLLIKRSMVNKEIALGKANYDNLKMEEKIKIKDINSIGYNMVEMDIIQFLNKIKKRIPDKELIQHVNYFCNLKGLSAISKKFILTMLSFPSKFIKYSLRYFENPAYYMQNVHIDKFKNALVLDGELLI